MANPAALGSDSAREDPAERGSELERAHRHPEAVEADTRRRDMMVYEVPSVSVDTTSRSDTSRDGQIIITHYVHPTISLFTFTEKTNTVLK